MTAQHTLGPWVNTDGEITRRGGHPYICTVVGAANPAYPQQAANAALIAAAPDLLQALQYILTYVDKRESEQGVDSFTHILGQAARAAIAKATGGKP